MARLVSLVVAVVTSLAGHGLLFFAAFYLQRSLTGFSVVALPVLVAPFAVLGVLLIGVAALTAAWSSLGVLVIGAVQVVVGLVGAFLPPNLGGAATRRWLDGALFRLGPLGQTADVWLVLGITLVEGVLLVVLGWTAARRRRSPVGSHAAARVISLVVVLVALGPVTLMTLHGGYLDYRRMFQLLAGPDILGAVLLIVGILLLAGLMLTARWSGLGAIVWGAVLALGSLSSAILPALLPRSVAPNPLSTAVRVLPADLAASVVSGVAIGGAAVIAVTFFFGGIATALAGRTGRRRATWVEPPTGEVPEVGPRWKPVESARSDDV